MMIIFVAIAVLGITTFIIQRLSQNNADTISAKCIYLAQAGIHDAIYDFRSHDLTGSGYFTAGQTDIDAGNFFVLGGKYQGNDADLLLVDTHLVALTNSNQVVNYWTIQNATNSRPITIVRMIVTWGSSRKLTAIQLSGGSLEWSGSLSSPANVNITDFTLNTIPTVYSNNYLAFNGGLLKTPSVTVTFIMSDGSSKAIQLYPSIASTNSNFTIKSMGKTIGSNIYRTISAEYNVVAGRIVSYDEISAQVAP